VHPVFVDEVKVVPAYRADAVTNFACTAFNEAATVIDARNALELGTLALQTPPDVSISGGMIDGTAIGTLNTRTAPLTSGMVTRYVTGNAHFLSE
jgi:hypothetical protein